jgi:amidase
MGSWKELGGRIQGLTDRRVTTNPYNTTLTSGGSSGGEGALVGFKGSCLGIGTDIGGSIRSPAANCGT